MIEPRSVYSFLIYEVKSRIQWLEDFFTYSIHT